MGLFSFLKDAGKKIFGGDDDKAPDTTKRSETIKTYIQGAGIPIQNLAVTVNPEGEVTLKGDVASQDDYEKIALISGNIQGVSSVNNEMTVNGQPADKGETKYHTVISGDTLWAISETHYGDGNMYMTIVEANQPMIKDADEIYPGQVLRIPAASA